MARLLDLSDDILLEVLSYLQLESPSPTRCPFHELPQFYRNHNRTELSKAASLGRLTPCCRRLHRLTSQFLYRYLPLITLLDGLNSRPKFSHSLNHILDSSFDLREVIREVHIYSVNAEGFCRLFCLPNIHTLWIGNWKDWEPLEQPNFNYQGQTQGFSSVTNLHLTRCGTHEEPLTQVLSWPIELTHLFLEVDCNEWYGHRAGEEPIEFTPTALITALQPHLLTLRQLTLTRLWPDHEGLDYPSRDHVLDVSDFKVLTSLRVAAVFFLSWDNDAEIISHLPPMLEELEVLYDDVGYKEFLPDGSGNSERPDWLFSLLGEKARGRKFTKLKRIRIISRQWELGDDDNGPYSWDDDSGGSDNDVNINDDQEDTTAAPVTDVVEEIVAPNSSWRPPKELIEAFKQAEVSFSLFIHPLRRYRYLVPGREWFRDSWEETYTIDLETNDHK